MGTGIDPCGTPQISEAHQNETSFDGDRKLSERHDSNHFRAVPDTDTNTAYDRYCLTQH